MTVVEKEKPKTPKGVLDELRTREAAWAKAEDESRRLSSEHGEKVRRYEALTDERRRLANREPALVDHRGAPSESGNTIAKIDEAIAELGDLSDLAARAQHAQNLAGRAKQSATDYAAAHFNEVVEALQPEAEAIVAEVRERAEALTESAESYLGLVQRVEGLRHGDRTLHGIRVPGLDEGAGLVRLMRGWRDTALPLPTELRR